MTQPLWYVRKNGSVKGPFPAPQIRQFHRLGEILGQDEISLDGLNWLKLADTELLASDTPQAPGNPDADESWHREREKARLRWLNDAVEIRSEAEDAIASLDEVSNRLRRHEADTRSLLTARSNRRPTLVSALLALLLIILLGIGVWYGQSDDGGIGAALSRKISQCDQPAAEAIVWAGCGKQDSDLRNARLRNANLSKTILERADLTGADLAYANLESANLRGVSLRGAILRGASMSRADLTGADLRDADLGFAVLGGAIMDGTRLEGARLGQSTWLDGRVCDARSVGQCR